MNGRQTGEQVLADLRTKVMRLDGLQPGERLDPSTIAKDLASSVTPVRRALAMLATEGLVASPKAGRFYVASIDELMLRDMYAWCEQLAFLSMTLWRNWYVVDWDRIETAVRGYPESVADLMDRIALASINREHGRAMALLSARLYAVRAVEPLVFEQAHAETIELASAFDGTDKDRLRRGIAGYHRRRVRAAATIVNALHQRDRVPPPTPGT